MADLIKVKGTSKNGKVCLWDRDARHPDGEVFVSGTDEAEVFPTVAVKAAIKAGTLVEVKTNALEYVVNTVKDAFTPEQPPVEPKPITEQPPVEPKSLTEQRVSAATPRQEGAQRAPQTTQR